MDTVARPTLARLVGDAEAFAEKHWGVEPLLDRAERPDRFADLYSPAAVDELLSGRGLRTPFIRLAKEGRTLPERSFTAPGGVGAAIEDQVDDTKVLAAFEGGATIVLQALHRTWPALTTFATALGEDLGHPVQVNSYTTPASNQGFDDHYDVHDVFVIQVAGTKRWRVRPPVRRWPHRDEPWTSHRVAVQQAATQAPLIETSLRPGDCLYLPRGFIHSATAEGTSTHLTIGVHTWTGAHTVDAILDDLRARLRDDESLRAPLPLGATSHDHALSEGLVERLATEATGAIRDALHVARAAAAVARALESGARRGARPEPLDVLAQADVAARVDEGGGPAVVRLRDGLLPRLDGDGLISRVATVRLTEPEQRVIRPLLADGHADVSALGAGLTATLLRAGVVVAT